MADEKAKKGYREKAKQLRLLAGQLTSRDNRVRNGLLNMAAEFEALSDELEPADASAKGSQVLR